MARVLEILKVILYLVGGGAVLTWGADIFVTSASHISRRFGISPVIIGLTVVAFGTSAPELAVNVLAAMKGSTELAMGNVVGSNIFNVGFILGICALIKPLNVSSQLIRIDIPIMILSSVALLVMSLNNTISNLEGYVLLGGIILYTILQIKLALNGKSNAEDFNREYSAKGSPLLDLFKLFAGLALLVGGAHFFVEGAMQAARFLGMSEAVIGLTIVAAGTSLPEVATSIAATLKGERDIAIGNVVGSNIFNILSVVGISSVIAGHLPVSDHMMKIDIVVMLGIALLCLPFIWWKKELGRVIGFLLFGSWISYTAYLIFQS